MGISLSRFFTGTAQTNTVAEKYHSTSNDFTA
jgi:hypothetical protein